MVNLRVEVVCPSLSALRIGAKVKIIAQRVKIIGDLLPFDRVFTLRILGNDLCEKINLLFLPKPFHLCFGESKNFDLIFEAGNRLVEEDALEELKIFIGLNRYHNLRVK